MAILIPAVTLVIPIWFLLLFRPLRINKIGPNAWVGIRTAETVKSQEAWEIAHTRAWPHIIVSSVVLGMILVGSIIWALTVEGDAQATVAGVGTAIGIIVWLVVLIIGAKAAHQEVKTLGNS